MSNQVISFDYVLTAKNGQVIDASAKGKPLIFLSGRGQIIPGLEEVLLAMQPLEKKTVTIAAEDAYGAYNERLIYKVSRTKLPAGELKLGDIFEVGQEGQFSPVTVSAIKDDEVTLDGNHPLAGEDLTFAVEITAKRPASVEELSHGHVHGAEGCHGESRHEHGGECGCQH
jgi:FKBP-type peptidyl-prolyl cis-trans isomerase SlyD